MIDAEHLDVFLDLSERLNFTRVAELRHLTQPAIHLQVRKLEAALGVTLYRRVGRRIEITREGWAVAAHAREARSRDGALVAGLRGERVAAPVVLAAGEGSTRFLLADAIRGAVGTGGAARARAAALRLLTAAGDQAAELVRDGRADLGVLASAEVPDGVASKVLDRVPLVVVAPRDHALGARARIAVADLDGVPLLVPPVGRPHRTRLAEVMAAAGAAMTVALEVGGWDAMVDFAALGLGVAVVNGFVPVPARLVARRLTGIAGPEYRVVWREGRLGPAGEALRDAIVAARLGWRARKDTAWARSEAKR